MMLLKDKVAIITGATKGIGRAIAEEFAKNGASLVLGGTKEELLNKAKEDLSFENLRHTVVIGDVSIVETSERLIEAALALGKKIDIIVNNAGIVRREPTEKMRLEDWQKVLDVNLNGTLYLCKLAMPILKKQQFGKIISISSGSAKNAHLGASPSYGASKAGIVYLTRHLATELGPYGINVNAICPGPIETDLTQEWPTNSRQNTIERIPLGRFGMPEEVAHLALFLASSLSDYITGESVSINGGLSMD
jgi:3-oxoacyl-[acyl-carrier protein] reductase